MCCMGLGGIGSFLPIDKNFPESGKRGCGVFWLGLSWSLRGLNLYSGLTQDFVRTCVLDFVLGYCLPPLRGWYSGRCRVRGGTGLF